MNKAKLFDDVRDRFLARLSLLWTSVHRMCCFGAVDAPSFAFATKTAVGASINVFRLLCWCCCSCCLLSKSRAAISTDEKPSGVSLQLQPSAPMNGDESAKLMSSFCSCCRFRIAIEAVLLLPPLPLLHRPFATFARADVDATDVVVLLVRLFLLSLSNFWLLPTSFSSASSTSTVVDQFEEHWLFSNCFCWNF